ncbi:YcaO-like family protein [Paenibacillus sp.]|jgi:ribosomal protein S12 methylthiotransferase accessory factor|uniref:YcaO-like family protein n=1 Tax=Paenibacillus sp. TaxID=58172 RepID=UPI002833B1DE|nr:YcaO-like family protein [Paenibacillus sp.]MDR0268519.1 YcaO-like family protein [Paenibacillus sp.]
MKELILYQTGSDLLQEVLQELDNRGVLYWLTDDRPSDPGTLLHVVAGGLIEEEFAPFFQVSSTSTGGVFFYHQLLNTLLVGPYMDNRGGACFSCLNRKLQAGDRENLISLLYGEPSPYSPHPQTAECIADIMEAFQLSGDLLERYAGRAEHIQFDAQLADSYLLNDSGNCPVCSPEITTEIWKRTSPFTSGIQSGFKTPPQKYRLNSYRENERVLERLYDRESGVITHSYRQMQSTMIEAERMKQRVGLRDEEAGSGMTYRRQDSKQVVILEAVERYCSMSGCKTAAAEKRSYAEVRHMAVNPADFGLHDAVSMEHPAYRLERYNEDLPIYWTSAYTMKEKREVLIPEQLVYFEEKNYRDQPNRFVYDSSSGLALGSTHEEAVMHGLFELIEWDHFLCAWYNRLPLQELDIEDTGLDELKQTLYFLELEGIRVRFFDITMELQVPSIWAVAYNARENAVMKACNATAAHFDPEKAIESAAMEVITALPVYEDALRRDEAMRARAWMLANDPDIVIVSEDHALYYACEQNCKNGLDFVLNLDEADKQPVRQVYRELFYENSRIIHDHLTEDLEELVFKVLRYYENIYVVDVTSEDIASCGLYAAKVLVPGMLPMTFGQQYKRIIPERLLRERKRRGLKEQFEWNTQPHPFSKV